MYRYLPVNKSGKFTSHTSLPVLLKIIGVNQYFRNYNVITFCDYVVIDTNFKCISYTKNVRCGENNQFQILKIAL